MSEKNTYDAFRKGIAIPRDRIDRIENIVGVGNPDVNCVLIGGPEIWIEIKSPKEPKRKTTVLFNSNHKLSQDQMNWFHRQHRAGGKGFVMVDTDKRRIMVRGALADSINSLTVDELIGIACWHAPKPTKKEQWDSLREVLIGG